MGLFRRGMRQPRNIEPSPEFVAKVAELIQANTPEQNIALIRAMHRIERTLIIQLEKIMHTLEEVLDAVTRERTKIDSLIALVNGLRQQVKDALGADLTPSQQMRVDQVFDAATAGVGAIDQALTDNTVAATAGAVSDGPGLSEIKSALDQEGKPPTVTTDPAAL